MRERQRDRGRDRDRGERQRWGETETLRERQRKEKGREIQKGRETERDFAGRLLHQRPSRQRPCHGGAASLPLLLVELSWASHVPA